MSPDVYPGPRERLGGIVSEFPCSVIMSATAVSLLEKGETFSLVVVQLSQSSCFMS